MKNLISKCVASLERKKVLGIFSSFKRKFSRVRSLTETNSLIEEFFIEIRSHRFLMEQAHEIGDILRRNDSRYLQHEFILRCYVISFLNNETILYMDCSDTFDAPGSLRYRFHLADDGDIERHRDNNAFEEGEDKFVGQVSLAQWIWIMRIDPCQSIDAHRFIAILKEECEKRFLWKRLDEIKLYEQIPTVNNRDLLVGYKLFNPLGGYLLISNFLKDKKINHTVGQGEYSLRDLNSIQLKSLVDELTEILPSGCLLSVEPTSMGCCLLKRKFFKVYKEALEDSGLVSVG